MNKYYSSIKFLFLTLVLIPWPLWAVAPNSQTLKISEERIIFHTNFGDLAVALYPQVAPRHCAQILDMTKFGIYTGAHIFRIESGFVAQVENYDNREKALTDDQLRRIHKLPAEFSSYKHRRGLLSMARFDDINSAEASFSFMLGPAPHLDGQYTIFGEVVKGLDVLAAIEATPVIGTSQPIIDVVIQTAEVVSAKELDSMKLAGAKIPTIPDAPYQLFFEVFACLAFSVTVLIPILKGLKA